MKRSLARPVAARCAFPLVDAWRSDDLFYVSFASRVLIYAIAATSLNLVLGYGGMVAFGHAAFVGAGAYVAASSLPKACASAWIALAGRGRGRGARRAGDRRDLAAHARRVLHHDHARVRADDVLPRQLDEGLRRRRGPDAAAARSSSASASTCGNDVVFYYVVLASCSPRCTRCTAWCIRASAG